MAYRIVYSVSEDCVCKKKLRVGNIAGYSIICLILFAYLTARFWPAGREVMEEALLPGDVTVTRQALVHMAENLRSGEAIGDAVVVFCREIVDGSGIRD